MCSYYREVWEVEYTDEFGQWWNFAFDPKTHAILLIGGDKSGQWNRWYKTAIPAADDLYDTHLIEINETDV